MKSKTLEELFQSSLSLLGKKFFLIIFALSLLVNFFFVFYIALHVSEFILDFIIDYFSLNFDSNAFFNYVLIVFRFLLSWILFSYIVIPFSNLMCGLISDFIFDKLPNRKNLSTPRFKNSFLLSILFSLRSVLFSILANIAALPIYLFVPGGNFVLFLLLNGYLFSRELSGCFIIQYKTNEDLKLFYNQESAILLSSGVIFIFLISLPLVRYVIPFIAILFYANLSLIYLKNIEKK